jgi:hypothetical protein
VVLTDKVIFWTDWLLMNWERSKVADKLLADKQKVIGLAISGLGTS